MRLNLEGQRFGRLLVLGFTEARKVGTQSKRFWNCRCDCGRESEVPTGALTQGNTTSCGCRSGGVTHGESGTPVYRVWHAMIERCRNPGDLGFKDYGGRGIRVCDAWLEFTAFRDAMGPRPEGGTLERENVNGNYEPSNCRWAQQIEQANNRRNNRRLTANGQTRTLAEWARAAGMAKTTLRHRLDSGWPIEEALTQRSSRGQRRDLYPL